MGNSPFTWLRCPSTTKPTRSNVLSPSILDMDSNPETCENVHGCKNDAYIGDDTRTENRSLVPQPVMSNGNVTPQQERIRVRAIYNYKGQHPDDLQFQKGDIMFITDRSEQWWFAHHVESGRTGYAPNNYLAIDDGRPTSLDAWYDIGRREADRLLLQLGNPDGSYLIRPSSDTKNYVLSVRHHDQCNNNWNVRHYRIEIEDDKYHINSRRDFSTIKELIDFYSESYGGLCCQLTASLPRDYRPPVQFRDFEVNRDSIRIVHMLGKGSYGEVWLAKWNESVDVAVKMRLANTDSEAFIQEARLMHSFQHRRIVQLLGVCTEPENEPIYIITELMSKGSLRQFLRHEERHLQLTDLIDIMAQISEGMSYLEERNSVHRDLRAANILVGADNSVKVADFGLAFVISDTTQQDRETKLPMRWTAPEVTSDRLSSIKSDVWSFGILMYEIVTYGGTPYSGKEVPEILAYIQKGYRLPNPHTRAHPCTKDLHDVMLRCWEAIPERRPTFRALYDGFENWAVKTETSYSDYG